MYPKDEGSRHLRRVWGPDPREWPRPSWRATRTFGLRGPVLPSASQRRRRRDLPRTQPRVVRSCHEEWRSQSLLPTQPEAWCCHVFYDPCRKPSEKV
jgi:hypothetical protein